MEQYAGPKRLPAVVGAALRAPAALACAIAMGKPE